VFLKNGSRSLKNFLKRPGPEPIRFEKTEKAFSTEESESGKIKAIEKSLKIKKNN